MTYVILLDEFDTEGWLQTQALFAPSFFSDQVKIYTANSRDRALEIEDLIDRSTHNTFLFLSVQRELRADDHLLTIRRYRYKTLFERIREEFSYCSKYENLLLVVDRIPHEHSSGEYVDKHKRLAIELDKQGFVEDNSQHSYLVSRDEFLALYSDVLELLLREDILDTTVKAQLVAPITSLLESGLLQRFDKAIQASNLERYYQNMLLLKERFIEEFLRLDFSVFDHREHVLRTMMQGLFGEIIGIRDVLDKITLLNYTPENIYLDDGEMNITIASLISLISNRQERVFTSGWFEVETLKTDRSYLSHALARLVALELPEKHENKREVTVHDLEQIILDVPPPPRDEIKPLNDLPYLYRRKRELELIQEVEGAFKMMQTEIAHVKEALIQAKEDIYLHPGTPVTLTLTIERLRVRSNEAIIPDYNREDEPLPAFERSFKMLRMQELKERVRNSYRKLPRTWTFSWMLLLIMITTFVPILMGYHKQLEVVFSLANLLIVLTLIGIILWFYVKLKVKLQTLLSDYRSQLRSVQKDLYNWYGVSVSQYESMFRTKLMFENRELYRSALRHIEEDEKQWTIHQNKIKTLNKQAKEIMHSCGLEASSSTSAFLPRSIIEFDPNQTLEYALFPEQKNMAEVITDQKMNMNAIFCYGVITKLQLRRFKMGE